MSDPTCGECGLYGCSTCPMPWDDQPTKDTEACAPVRALLECRRERDEAQARVKVLDMLAGISDVHVSELSRERDEWKSRASEYLNASEDYGMQAVNARARIAELEKALYDAERQHADCGLDYYAQKQAAERAEAEVARLTEDRDNLAGELNAMRARVERLVGAAVERGDEVARLRWWVASKALCQCEPSRAMLCFPCQVRAVLNSTDADKRNRKAFGVGLKKDKGE